MPKTSCKKGHYYCNTDKKCKPIPDGYKMREDGFLVKEGWSNKYKKSIDCDNPKGFSQKAHCAGKKKVTEESNPRIARKKGQPAKSKKHSDLYTDEDPKGTIHGLGFKDVATAKASVAKIRKSSRSHAHKIQAAIAMEQRARVMGKTSEAAVYRKFINSMKKKTKAMNEGKSHKGDHEYEMIRRQTDNVMVSAKKIKKKVGKGEGDVKAWVQSKITKAADYLDTAADYMTDKEEVKEGSLRKWFKGSKSKDGKGGWVNVVTGGTCASDEPGEGTPKCVSSAKRASMSKKERLSAARRKKKADPNQQSKSGAAKPTYVSTDKKSKKKKKMKEEFISLPLQLEVPQNDGEFKLGLMFRESLEQDRGMLFIFEETDYYSFHMKNTFIPLDIAFINEEGIIESIKELDPMNPVPVYPDGDIRYAIEVNRGWFAENGVEVGDILLEDTEDTEIDLTEVKDRKGKGSGTKDACYHKVKSRYSVWPSAYASGALVKCRKVGAKNWGNSKKEEVEYEYEVPIKARYSWRDSISEHHRKDEDGNTIPHEDDIKEGHYGSAVNKIPAELDKAVALHKSQAERLRKSPEFKKDAGKKANAIPGQLDKAVAMHTKQAKELRAAGVGDDKNCGCGQTPCKTYGKKKEMKKEEFSDWRQELEEKKGQKCWPGYEKKGTKMMFGKRYNNCVKKTKKEELEVETPSLSEKVGQEFAHTAGLVKRSDKTVKYKPYTYDALQRFYATSTGAGSIYEKKMTKKQMKKRDEIADAIGKKDMKKRYGDENVRYAIATKIAMKEQLGGTGKKEAPSPQQLKNNQTIAQRKKLQSDLETAGNQRMSSTTTTTGPDGKFKSMSISDAGTVKSFQANAINKLGKMGGAKLEMDAGGLVPNIGKFTQDVGKNALAKNSLVPSAMKSELNKGLANTAQKINQETPGTDAYRLKTAAMQVNQNVRKNQNLKASYNMKEMGESIVDDALTIQDWNVDDIKFTEIETVDIIKAKPLKESHSNWRNSIELDEKMGYKIIKKLVQSAMKKAGKVKGPFNVTGKQAGKMKRTGSTAGSNLNFPVDKTTSKNIQTKSIINKSKKAASDALSKSASKKGDTPVKVNLQKKINFDKYFSGDVNTGRTVKRYGTGKPTGTFTDDLPKPKVEPLKQSQKDLIKATEKVKSKTPKTKKTRTPKDQLRDIESDPKSKEIRKQIEKETGTKTREFTQKGGVTKGNENENLSNLPKNKKNKPLKDHYDWRNQLDDDVLYRLDRFNEDWQKVNKKDKTDGMSQKAVNAYKKENPGSKLKTAVTTKPSKLKKGSKASKRRKSFCARSNGQKKMHNIDCSKTPDKAICKARRRWNC